MFETWGRIVFRRRALALVIAAAGMVFAAVWGTQVFGALSSGDTFTPPDSQSQREADAAARTFGRNTADVVVLYRSARLTVAEPAYRKAVTSALASLPRRAVPSVSTYWSTRPPQSASLVSRDRHETYAVLVIVVGAFSASGITFIKLIGAGMIIAPVIDASVVGFCWSCHHAAARPGQLVGARAIAPPVRPVRHRGDR
jgi:RND superfamily putative drug exporter